ncbi:Uncharacterised protein [Mycobacteroides abscessus subsp. abscessus]|nr:Uncharacterised protein [Mycobacteroides abscessus subsp. abscessus]
MARVATGGRKRITVPARPQSTVPPPSAAGVTVRVSASPVISVPSARRPAIMRSVSRLRSAPVMVEGPSASAARISARLVIDLDPGRVTVACTGTSTWGAGQ